MRRSPGFTLVEFLIATLIFTFMIMSLTLFYSTAHKHMFQNYRQNTIKSNGSLAIKTITSRLQEANRIDLPVASGNFLAFASNVDQVSGCYPINPAMPALTAWHYFCHVPGITGQCPLGNCLFYHTAPIAGGGTCPTGPAWDPVNGYPVAGNCGLNTRPGETVTLLSSFVAIDQDLFSRPAGGLGNLLVDIRLHLYWDPWAQAVVGRDFRSTSKIIDTTLNTTVKVVMGGQ